MRQRYSWRWPFRQQPKHPYPVVSGRELYEGAADSVTGLAYYPVVTLSNYVCANSITQPDPPEFTAQEITERLLVDGSLIRYKDEWVGHLTCVEKDEIRQLIPDNKPFTGLHTEVCWNYYPSEAESVEQSIEATEDEGYGISDDYKDDDRNIAGTWTRRVFAADADTPTSVTYGIQPSELQMIYFNGLGLLYPNQGQYHRLEEIGRTLKGQTTGAAMKALVHGYIRNAGMAKDQLNNDEFVAVLPGDLRVDRMSETGVLDSLRAEFDMKLPLYLASMNIADMAYKPDRPVGQFLTLLMEPMMRYVEETRTRVRDVLEIFGASIEFEKIFISSVQDRTAEFLLLQQARAADVITAQEFKDKAARLV